MYGKKVFLFYSFFLKRKELLLVKFCRKIHLFYFLPVSISFLMPSFTKRYTFSSPFCSIYVCFLFSLLYVFRLLSPSPFFMSFLLHTRELLPTYSFLLLLFFKRFMGVREQKNKYFFLSTCFHFPIIFFLPFLFFFHINIPCF